MTPDEFRVDEEWSELNSELVVASFKAAEAEQSVHVNGPADGRRERLESAELAVAEARLALADREKTFSDPRWGSW